MGLRVAWCAACVLLAACSFGGPKSSAELSTEDACRALADRAYNEQHRAQLSEGMDQGTSPFSGGGSLVAPDAGLSDQYAHEVAVDNCIARRTSSTAGGASYGPAGSH